MTYKYNPTGFTLQDLDNILQKMQSSKPVAPQPMVVGEFGALIFDLFYLRPAAKNIITHWYLPKRVKKILAEGRIGGKTSNRRVIVYQSAWVSESGIVQFIGPANELVDRSGKKFRYELYDGTTLLLQTNDLSKLLNA